MLSQSQLTTTSSNISPLRLCLATFVFSPLQSICYKYFWFTSFHLGSNSHFSYLQHFGDMPNWFWNAMVLATPLPLKNPALPLIRRNATENHGLLPGLLKALFWLSANESTKSSLLIVSRSISYASVVSQWDLNRITLNSYWLTQGPWIADLKIGPYQRLWFLELLLKMGLVKVEQ